MAIPLRCLQQDMGWNALEYYKISIKHDLSVCSDNETTDHEITRGQGKSLKG